MYASNDNVLCAIKIFHTHITQTLYTLERSGIIGEKGKEKEKKMETLNLGAQESDVKSLNSAFHVPPKSSQNLEKC